MKELTIEEKAKAYDEAIKVANKYKDTHIMFPQIKDEMFPELKESEDERIRKALKEYFINSFQNNDIAAILGVHIKDVLAWLEKQGERANFINKIQIGDKVTRNEDGILVNLSQLNRVAKKQGEQKPDELVKEYDFHGMEFVPKFKKGDLIREKLSGRILTIKDFSYDNGLYTYDSGQFPITIQDNYEIIEQKPADKKGMNLVEEEMTPFQKEVFCIIDTTIEEEQGLKQVCDKLFALASNEIKQKSAWSEEGKLSNK